MDCTNAKTELLDVLTRIGKQPTDIIAMTIRHELSYDHAQRITDIDSLDFTYDSGYGSQELHGTILFNDNTWLSRSEYDGSEWWNYNVCPTIEDVQNLYTQEG